jgi:hypothetical protein
VSEGFHNFLPGDTDKKKKHAQEVFDMIQKSYASQGGIHGSGFKSPDDMIQNIPMWKLHKEDGKITSVALYKDSGGRKRVAVGTNGEDSGKKSAVDVMINDLKHHRANMEVSGKSLSFIRKNTNIMDHVKPFEYAKDYHKSKGVDIVRPPADDPEVKRHPDLKDHFYSRKIGGEYHTKLMLGEPGNKII